MGMYNSTDKVSEDGFGFRVGEALVSEMETDG